MKIIHESDLVVFLYKKLFLTSDALFIRRISAVSNSIQRIKFGRNSTSESAVAFLPQAHEPGLTHKNSVFLFPTKFSLNQLKENDSYGSNPLPVFFFKFLSFFALIFKCIFRNAR